MKKKKKIVKKKKIIKTSKKSIRQKKKKAQKKSASSARAKTSRKEEKPIGEITHFFSHLSVAVMKTRGLLSVGDTIKVKGATTDFDQVIESLQVDHMQVTTAKKGALVGLKVKSRVREGDLVFKAE